MLLQIIINYNEVKSESQEICFPALSCKHASCKVLLIVDPVNSRSDNSRSLITDLLYRPFDLLSHFAILSFS